MSAPVSGSRLRHRLVLQQAVYLRDEIGGTAVSWQDIFSFWAHIVPVRADNLFVNQKFSPRRMFKITARYEATFVANQRLRYGKRLFLIHTVENQEERNHTVEMICEETS